MINFSPRFRYVVPLYQPRTLSRSSFRPDTAYALFSELIMPISSLNIIELHPFRKPRYVEDVKENKAVRSKSMSYWPMRR